MVDSFRNYIGRLGELEPDSPIARAMIDKLNGRSVQWEGLVENVSFNEGKIFVWLKCLDPDVQESFYAIAPESQRELVITLQKGELVLVSGTLILANPVAPKIIAVGIDRI